MSMFNQVCRLVAILALAAIPSTVRGQAWHPFADPMEFDPDWQFFAPVDADYLEELAPRKRAHVGWFGTYDRSYTLVSRSRQESVGGGGDFTWANRYEFGFMNQKESGWLFTHRHMGGPNVYERTFQPRVNQINTADTTPLTTNTFPSIERNDAILQERAYILGDSINVGSYSSFEINKTFRLEPYRYGGILEPMIGVRYSSFKDYSLNQDYFTNFETITAIPVPTTRLTETLTSYDWTIRNEMFGGQIGARYFNHVGRWTLSTELRAFGMGNYRREEQHAREIKTEYASIAESADVVQELTTMPVYVKPRGSTKIVPGFEIRAEAAYQLTKYIDVRGGVDFIDLAANIRRGTVVNGPNFGQAVENSVQMTGFTFGIAINR